MEIPVTFLYGIVITVLVIFAMMYGLSLNDIRKTEKTLSVNLPGVMRHVLIGNLILTFVALGVSLIFLIL